MNAPNLDEGYLNKKIQFGNSIKVSTVQPNVQLIIFVDTHSCRPING